MYCIIDEKQVVQATKFHGEIDDVAGLLYKSKKYTEQDSRQHYQVLGVRFGSRR